MAARVTERRIRGQLDSWHFWMAVAYVGIAVSLVGLYFLAGRQANEQAKRIAIQRAAAQAEVTNCANGVKNAPVIAGFMSGQRALVTNSILSTTAALAAEDFNDPLRHVRLASLVRLRRALRNLNSLDEIVLSTSQTKPKCNALARRLGVAPPFPGG